MRPESAAARDGGGRKKAERTNEYKGKAAERQRTASERLSVIDELSPRSGNPPIMLWHNTHINL